MNNIADPKFREVKDTQGGPQTSTADLFRLDGRTVIVTGGAGALGVEVAATVIESGGDVVCLDVAKDLPEPQAAHLNQLAEKRSQKLSYYQLDVIQSEAITKTFATFAPTLRYPIRGLVACAGIADNGPSHEFPPERFRRVMEVNCIGTFAVAQATAIEMQKANVSGSMILVASMSGTVVNKGVESSAYNTSKSALLQLARNLAAEWGSSKGMPLIRVNTLSPGYIKTPATMPALEVPGLEDQWVDESMLYRLSLTHEYRGPVLFLLSDASSFMTAADLRVDGGHCSW